MTKEKYFYLEDSILSPGKYILKLDVSKLGDISTIGSYNILPARLLNLEYADYLRFCRDVIGGEITGRGKVYPIVVFKKSLELRPFVRLLNSRLNLVIWEKNHPNWREHQEFVAELEKNKKIYPEEMQRVLNERNT